MVDAVVVADDQQGAGQSDIEIGPHPICGSGRRDRLDTVGVRERAADAVEDVREDGTGLPDGDVVASRPAPEDTSRGSGVLRSYGGQQTDSIMHRLADSWELQEAMIDGLAGTDGSDGNAILLMFKLEPTGDDLDALESHLRATHETVMQAQAAWELTPEQTLIQIEHAATLASVLDRHLGIIDLMRVVIDDNSPRDIIG